MNTQRGISVLLTNDDGVDAPIFHAFLSQLRAQSWCREVRVVVPKHEQSWVAQSVTRFRPLQVEQRDFGGYNGFVVDGTPADCVSLGVTDLFPDRPDLILSGINFGTNESLAFYLNSGTVGGARQGIVFGIRAIAVSLKMPGPIFKLWRDLNIPALEAHHDDWKRVTRVASGIVGKLIDDSCWAGVDLFTLNMPWSVDETSEIRLTHLERVTYPKLFHVIEDGRFRHHLEALIPEPDEERSGRVPSSLGTHSDMQTLNENKVSLCPIRYDLLPKDEELLERLRQKFN